jgi:hypothetical protein
MMVLVFMQLERMNHVVKIQHTDGNFLQGSCPEIQKHEVFLLKQIFSLPVQGCCFFPEKSQKTQFDWPLISQTHHGGCWSCCHCLVTFLFTKPMLQQQSAFSTTMVPCSVKSEESILLQD